MRPTVRVLPSTKNASLQLPRRAALAGWKELGSGLSVLFARWPPGEAGSLLQLWALEGKTRLDSPCAGEDFDRVYSAGDNTDQECRCKVKYAGINKTIFFFLFE